MSIYDGPSPTEQWIATLPPEIRASRHLADALQRIEGRQITQDLALEVGCHVRALEIHARLFGVDA